jgi:hypothetical protein
MVRQMGLTRERLLEVLDYDPTTGIFVWKARPDNKRWTAKNAGKVAGSPHNGGYIHIGIDGKKYLAHALAWLFVYGEPPNRFIDHKNLDKKDNRIDNLRLADFGENSANAGIRSDNKSGYRGVSFWGKRQCWAVYINKAGRHHYVGSFKVKEDAALAYAEAAKKLYGDFCPDYLKDAG